MDALPVETIVSSVTSHEDVDVKEAEADATEENLKEPPSPAIAQPAHTSPDLSFASEVTMQNSDLQYQIQERGNNTLKFNKRKSINKAK